MTQEFLLIIATLLTALLGLIIGYVALSYRQLLKKYLQLKSAQESQEALSQAQADQIIAEAKKQADQVLQWAGEFNQKMQQDLFSELANAKSKQEQNYQQILQTVQKESINMINNISKDIKQEIQSQVRDSNKAVLQELLAKHQTANEAIQKYKEHMLQQVDESIYQILAQASEQALGESLSLEDHEDLVMKSLNAAKRQNIL